MLIITGTTVSRGSGAIAEDSLSVSVPPRSGDVVLRQGTGFWSVVFANLNRQDRRFSHVGIVVREERRWRVIHAEADNLGRHGAVRIDDWNDFVAGVARVAMLRLEDTAAAARAADTAWHMYRDTLPFDLRFDLEDAEAVYCTELAWRALSHALGRDPLPDKPVIQGREVVLVENFLLDIPELKRIYVTHPESVARLAGTRASP